MKPPSAPDVTEQPATQTGVACSVGFGFYKCRPGQNGIIGWVAWATLIPMTDNGPVAEPADPLWFAFGATEDEAISRVQAEVERAAGVDEWQRQEA